VVFGHSVAARRGRGARHDRRGAGRRSHLYPKNGGGERQFWRDGVKITAPTIDGRSIWSACEHASGDD